MIFVGERQSPKAARYGHTWENGEAAAATLHRALLAAGVDPFQCEFLNLWIVPGLKDPKRPPRRDALRRLQKASRSGERIVALGSLVARELQPSPHPLRPAAPPGRPWTPAQAGVVRGPCARNSLRNRSRCIA